MRIAVVVLLGLVACGERIVELDPADAGPPCDPGLTQCSNCVDDDADGDVDGRDVECTGAADDDEGSFDTDIENDNRDQSPVDCFYDGNSGSGDDHCNLHVCCVLDECPPDLPGAPFDPTACEPASDCIDRCTPLVPPGCDCFGCCTICDDAGCESIYVNPALAPDCDASTLHDADVCPRCAPIVACGAACGGDTCILCPGQTEADLPASCSGATCPDGDPPCETSLDCGARMFCAAGCCIAAIP